MALYPFSDLIRGRRREKRMSQRQVAEASGDRLSQPVLSDWETGSVLPDVGDSRLTALADALDLPRQQVDAALSEQLASKGQETLLTEERYLQEQQDYLEGQKPEDVDIWLLGPETLPVIHSPRVRDVWRQNLERGVSYRIVWLLCMVRSGTLPRLASVLREIEPKRWKGTIHHYGLELFALKTGHSDLYTENASDYVELSSEAIPGNSFHGAFSLEPESPLFATLVRTFSDFSSITVCRPRSKSREPLASVHLPEMRHSLGGSEGPAWHVFGTEKSFRLATFLKKFEDEVATREARVGGAPVALP